MEACSYSARAYSENKHTHPIPGRGSATEDKRLQLGAAAACRQTCCLQVAITAPCHCWQAIRKCNTMCLARDVPPSISVVRHRHADQQVANSSSWQLTSTSWYSSH